MDTSTVTADVEIGGDTGDDHDPRYPHRRKAFGMTIGKLADTLDDGAITVRATGDQITVRQVNDSPAFVIDGKEYPSTMRGWQVLGERVGIPEALATQLWDQYPAEGESLLNTLYHGSTSTHAIRVHPDFGVRDIRPATTLYIPPSAIAGVLAERLGADGEVSSFSIDRNFLLDVVSPVSPERWRGDAAVGDITATGLTISQKLSPTQFHAPKVGLYFHRLICTNGMIVRRPEDKVDARMTEIETASDWLAAFDGLVNEMLGRSEHIIDSFYDMRNEKIANPAQWLRRVGRELGLSDRIILRLTDALVEWVDDRGEATAFDLVNLVTHFANAPGGRGDDSRRLMLVGGAMVTEHHIRCSTCQSRLD